MGIQFNVCSAAIGKAPEKCIKWSLMRILVIPTTDWTRHPVPNRLNFIFDILAERNDVFVLHFALKKFRNVPARETRCTLIPIDSFSMENPACHYLLNAPLYLPIIRRIVREKEIDVILSANVLPSLCANFSGVPVVFDYLDHIEESAAVYYPDSLFQNAIRLAVRSVTRFNLKHATSVITVTEDFKEYLGKLGISHVEVIYNGVDTAKLIITPEEEAKRILGLSGTVIGYVGSLEQWVDLETIISALPDLEVTILIVGPGLFTDYGSMIKNMADTLNVGQKIIFTGMVPFDRLGLYISAMDIGLNPLKKMKKNEMTIGGKIFNYLACGKPVLSSRMIALERLFGDDLFYFDDRESFIAQVKRILSLPGEEKKYREIAQRFDWDILSKRYEQVLQKAVDQ